MSRESDSLAALFDNLESAPAAAPAVNTAPAWYAPAIERGVSETCPKCRGSGRFVSYTGRNVGECFTCKGKGTRQFKNDAATRAAARDKSADRKARKSEESLAAFAADYPAIWQWMDGSTFPFAVAMRDAIAKYGSLTDRQMAACENCVAKLAAAKAAAADRRDNAAAIDTGKIEAAMAKAGATAKLRFAEFTISPASASGRNAGAYYVKANDGARTYLGKIQGGRFFRSRDCTDSHESALLAIANDPAGAAIAYGKLSRRCSCCGLTLTNPVSIDRGIGPICFDKYFG